MPVPPNGRCPVHIYMYIEHIRVCKLLVQMCTHPYGMGAPFTVHLTGTIKEEVQDFQEKLHRWNYQQYRLTSKTTKNEQGDTLHT